MRDPERIDKVLDVIRRTWKAFPDLRLGQLLSNVIPGEDPVLREVRMFYIEDEELADRIIKMYGDRE